MGLPKSLINGALRAPLWRAELRYESYDTIVIPIANELALHREKYPMTIIYLKRKYCGYVYSLFEQILQDKQFVGDTKDPGARLFAQFHAPQTRRMKKSLIAEKKKENSRVRVLLATSALGMGVNVPHVEHAVHITPPSNIESYVQETGRAGRTGVPSKATLHYNNSDISTWLISLQLIIIFNFHWHLILIFIIIKYFRLHMVKLIQCPWRNIRAYFRTKWRQLLVSF